MVAIRWFIFWFELFTFLVLRCNGPSSPLPSPPLASPPPPLLTIGSFKRSHHHNLPLGGETGAPKAEALPETLGTASAAAPGLRRGLRLKETRTRRGTGEGILRESGVMQRRRKRRKSLQRRALRKRLRRPRNPRAASYSSSPRMMETGARVGGRGRRARDRSSFGTMRGPSWV